MSVYKTIVNIHTGDLQLVYDTALLKVKASVDTYDSLPITGNVENDLRITQDTDRMYTWSVSATSGDRNLWLDIGRVSSVDWSAITNKPTSDVADIDDAVAKKHTQNTDTKLDEGGGNEVAVADVKSAVDLKHSNTSDHTQNTDTKLDEGGGDETSASELRIALDTTIPSKIDKISADSEVKLLVSFDGVDLATTAVDQSDSSQPMTFNGASKLDSSQSKFGNASLSLNGSVGNYVQMDNLSADFNLGISDWTIDAWCRTGVIPDDSYYSILAKWEASGSQRSWMLNLVKVGVGSVSINFQWSTTGSNEGDETIAITWPINTFNLISAERVGNNVYIYLNGVKINTIDVTGATFLSSTAKTNVGAIDNIGSGSNFTGHINEVRLVKGTGLYAGTTFTPPTKPFSFLNIVPVMDINGDVVTTAVDKISLESSVTHSKIVTGNPHSVTKSEVGLSSVPNVDATDADNVDADVLGTPTYKSMQQYLDTIQSSGIIDGGIITDAGSGTVDVSAIKGILKTTDSDIGDDVFFDVAGLTAQALTDNSINHIIVDYNSGTPQIIVSVSEAYNGQTTFLVGEIYREGTQLDILQSGSNIANFYKKVQQHHVEERAVDFVSGAVVDESGTRNISITSGIFYAGINRILTDVSDTSKSDDITGGGSGGTISANNTIVLDSGEGDVTSDYSADNYIIIENSSNGNNGVYRVVSSSWNASNTTVVVVETTLTTGADTGNVLPFHFEYYYYNGSAWIENDLTQIDNEQYNNIASGLVSLANNQYGVHWVYKGTNSHVFVVYGQDTYSLTEAKIAQPPSSLPSHIEHIAILRAKIIIKKSEATFTEVANVSDVSFVSTTPTDHNELSSLQGGIANEYYHLTATELSNVPDVDVTPVNIQFIIDGGGSAITTGVKGYIEIPFDCTIQRVTMLLDQSSTTTVDIWKDSYANYPPTDADSITASAVPGTSATDKDQDATLTGWTVALSAGDIIGFNVDANDNAERITISLKAVRT